MCLRKNFIQWENSSVIYTINFLMIEISNDDSSSSFNDMSYETLIGESFLERAHKSSTYCVTDLILSAFFLLKDQENT